MVINNMPTLYQQVWQGVGMRKITLLGIVVALVICTVASASNAGWAWNQFASQYHFAGYPQSARTTVGQAYSGSDYNADINGICEDMSEVLASPVFPPDGPEDVLNAWIDSQ